MLIIIKNIIKKNKKNYIKLLFLKYIILKKLKVFIIYIKVLYKVK